MSDLAATLDSKTVSHEPSLVDGVAAPPCLRMVGYCGGCGTWDEHGPTCVSCGYEFSGEPSRPSD